MDYRVYKGGVQSINHGEDPYSVVNIHHYTREFVLYTYPPHTLLFYWCLQFFFVFQSIWIYYIFLFAFLVAGGYLIVTLDNKPQYLFFITLVLTGFISTYWNFYTGNKDILFLFLFACIFYLLVKEKFWQSSIIMGLMGSFTLVTLPFMVIYLVVRRSFTERVKYILLSISVVAAIFIITWGITPSLLVSYIETLRGSTSPFYEPPGWITPTPFLFFGVLLNQMNEGISIPSLFFSLVYICIITCASYFAIKKNQENPLKVYSLAMFAIFMVLPRIKAYYFIVLALPLYILFKDYSYKVKILVLIVVSALPLFFWCYPFLGRYYPEIYQIGSLPYLIFTYSQTISLFMIFTITIVLEYYQPLFSLGSHS